MQDLSPEPSVVIDGCSTQHGPRRRPQTAPTTGANRHEAHARRGAARRPGDRRARGRRGRGGDPAPAAGGRAGGEDYPYGGVRVTAGGSGPNAWYVFEPTHPRPASAPLAVVTHGYYEFAGHGVNDALARHTARMGNVVIYPRWQTDIAVPCPGPFDIEPCVKSEVAGIKGALAHLRADKARVQPQLDRAAYFGFSFGGIITADLANRYKSLGVPRPRAVWLDDPHDGGLAGSGEPALDDSLAGIPSSTKLVCHSGREGVIAEPGKADGSCNAVFAKLRRVPAANKSLVMTSPDDHGTPALSSRHGVCAGPGARFSVDAYDWGFCWRSWDALRSCAYTGRECAYALGDTPQNRFIGTWSDGTPIVGLKIRTRAPIRPQPAPARAPARPT